MYFPLQKRKAEEMEAEDNKGEEKEEEAAEQPPSKKKKKKSAEEEEEKEVKVEEPTSEKKKGLAKFAGFGTLVFAGHQDPVVQPRGEQPREKVV